MARQTRTNAISARVDDADFEEANQYVEAAKIALADLVRLGVKEYIANHPVKVEAQEA